MGLRAEYLMTSPPTRHLLMSVPLNTKVRIQEIVMQEDYLRLNEQISYITTAKSSYSCVRVDLSEGLKEGDDLRAAECCCSKERA